jgi:hypothetical protein
MEDKILNVTPDVYEAVMELRDRLREEYGSDVTTSDAIDFLGNQYFIHLKLLDLVKYQLKKMQENTPRADPSLIDSVLGFLGLSTSQRTLPALSGPTSMCLCIG